MVARRASRFVLAALLAGASAGAGAQSPADDAACPAAYARVVLEAGVELCAATIREPSRETYEAEGAVTIVIREEGARLQADRVTVTDRRDVVAEGNVLVVWGTSRLSGTRMTYDIQNGTGAIENAIGLVEPEFNFTADEAKKIGEDRLHLRNATVTTCTQPVPYWSFAVSRAKIRVDHYARMTNLRLRVGRVPVFWLPYMVWPVKRDRAAGLLFPNFGSTRDRGRVVGEGIFLPLGESADLTVFGEYYTRAGWGGGGALRAIPNRDGSVSMRGFYIDDQVDGFGRYTLSYQQTQKFLNGFRMIADINQVSDFDFYNDYERELRLVSSPTILARIEFTRNGARTGLNVRELRREQLFSDGTSLVQQTLPEIEWRGRSARLGHTPFYLTYEASLANIQQTSTKIDADYLRGDLAPTITVPFSPRPWLDITPGVNLRATWWSQSQTPRENLSDPVSVSDDDLSRLVAGASLEIVGPKIFRIFERSGREDATRYKHTLESVISYRYQQPYDRSQEVLLYDEVDGLIGAIDQLSYGVRSRLFAQRPRAKPPEPETEGERILVGEGNGDRLREAEADAPASEAADRPRPREPVEIASFELSQVRSFDRPLSFADLDGDRVSETSSNRSDIAATGRFNPTTNVSLDLRARYDVLYDRVSNVSLSGFMRNDVVRSSFSVVHRAGLVPGTTDSTQLRLGAGVTLWGGRVRVDFDGSFVPTAEGASSRIPDQRWRVEYYLQCCGFLAEYFSRDFVTSQRRDFRFTVDLRGIGKLLDFKGGYEN